MQINPSRFSYAPATLPHTQANRQTPKVVAPAQRQGAEIAHSASIQLFSLLSDNPRIVSNLTEKIQQLGNNGIEYYRLKYLSQSNKSNLTGFVLEPKGDQNKNLPTILNPNATEANDILDLFEFMINQEKKYIDAFQKSSI
jgi:hypothetical protein